MLGKTLVPLLRAQGHDVLVHARSSQAEYRADLAQPGAAANLLAATDPDVLVNLAGVTDVDRCQTQPHEAYLANVLTVENLARAIAAARLRCHLVQISTDQVYDGAGPHAEGDARLTNVYAFSKYAGELAAVAVPSTILRTNFFGRSESARRQSLTDWLYRSLSNEASIQLFDDVRFSPLSMQTLAEMLERVVRKRPVGLFNLGSHDGMSKTDFALRFAAGVGLQTRTVRRTTTAEVDFLKTYRPKDMRMDSARFEAAMNLQLPTLADELERVARHYREHT